MAGRRAARLFSLDLGFDAALAHGLGEFVEERAALFPGDTAVGNAHAILQGLARHEVLPPAFEMAFHHDAEDALFAAADLRRDVVSHVELLLRILAAVAVAEIDHELGRNAGLRETFARRI